MRRERLFGLPVRRSQDDEIRLDPEWYRARMEQADATRRAATALAGELIGLDYASAESRATEAGCTLRVVRRDGQSLPVTADLRYNRINVELQRGLVAAAEVG